MNWELKALSSSFSFLASGSTLRSNQPASSLSLISLRRSMMANIWSLRALASIGTWLWESVANSVSNYCTTTCHRLQVSPLALKTRSLVPLNLVRLENQFGKFILRFCFSGTTFSINLNLHLTTSLQETKG